MSAVFRFRRWIPLLLLVVIASVTVYHVRRHRPLNAEERFLLGTWENPQPFSRYDITFTADRRYSVQLGGGGSWSRKGSQLVLKPDRPPISCDDTWETMFNDMAASLIDHDGRRVYFVEFLHPYLGVAPWEKRESSPLHGWMRSTID